MGGTSEQGDDARDNEKPVHKVLLSPFYIGETEVTQALWEAVMGSNPSDFKGVNRPVENVSWNDCQEFIIKLNEITGLRFRLPTEAEWEYAARGGNKSKGYVFSGCRNVDNLYKVAWYVSNSNQQTHDVKTKKANELGLYDMTGNVEEWVSDLYDIYLSSAQTNPTGPSEGSSRIYRGGGYSSGSRRCRVSLRSNFRPDWTSSSLGFRLAIY